MMENRYNGFKSSKWKNEKVFATRELETEEMTSLYKTEQEARDNYTSYNGSYSETTQK